MSSVDCAQHNTFPRARWELSLSVSLCLERVQFDVSAECPWSFARGVAYARGLQTDACSISRCILLLRVFHTTCVLSARLRYALQVCKGDCVDTCHVRFMLHVGAARSALSACRFVVRSECFVVGFARSLQVRLIQHALTYGCGRAGLQILWAPRVDSLTYASSHGNMRVQVLCMFRAPMGVCVLSWMQHSATVHACHADMRLGELRVACRIILC